MSDTGSEHDGRQSPGPSAAPPRTMHWSFVAIPAVAFVIGLLIGGLVIGAGTGGDDEPTASETVTPGPSTDESSDTTVVVPHDCVQAAESVREATQLIRDNLSAIQDFRAQKIIDMLNELEDLSAQANDQAKSCSDVEISTPSAPSATP